MLCGICGSKHIKTYQSNKRQDELVTILVDQHSIGKALGLGLGLGLVLGLGLGLGLGFRVRVFLLTT